MPFISLYYFIFVVFTYITAVPDWIDLSFVRDSNLRNLLEMYGYESLQEIILYRRFDVYALRDF